MPPVGAAVRLPCQELQLAAAADDRRHEPASPMSFSCLGHGGRRGNRPGVRRRFVMNNDAGRQSAAVGAGLVLGLGRLLGGDGVAAGQPAAKVDVGAALRAERAPAGIGRPATDRAGRLGRIGHARDVAASARRVKPSARRLGSPSEPNPSLRQGHEKSPTMPRVVTIRELSAAPAGLMAVIGRRSRCAERCL